MQSHTSEGLLFPALPNMLRASIDAPTFVDQFFLSGHYPDKPSLVCVVSWRVLLCAGVGLQVL